MRARETYVQAGPLPFGDAEILALMLGVGTAEHTTLGIAAQLLDRFGDLDGLAKAEPGELQCIPGVGQAKAVQLHAGLTAGRRSLQRPLQPPSAVLTPEAAIAHLGPPLRGLVHEELHALYLDRRRHPIARRQLTKGSDAFTVVDPRQIFRPAVALGASGVVLAHNHPSGDPTPSSQDRQVTRRCVAAGGVLGIVLLDHLVVAGQQWVSMAELGACQPA